MGGGYSGYERRMRKERKREVMRRRQGIEGRGYEGKEMMTEGKGRARRKGGKGLEKRREEERRERGEEGEAKEEEVEEEK